MSQWHRIHSFVYALASIALLMGVQPSRSYAQSTDSHWGVSASVTPSWKASEGTIKESLLNFEGEGTVEGTEFTIGFVRGSTRGGDWGVSFVRKPFKDGSGTTLVEDDFRQTRTTQDVFLQGVEFHWAKPFVTFADRVQIGVNIAGGIAQPKGDILETQSVPFEIPPGVPGSFAQQICQSYTEMGITCVLSGGQLVTTELRPAKDVMYSAVPLVKLEATAAVILAPGLKVRFSGGLNMPSNAAFRIAAVYLIGAR
jgi:hypothetical protein